MSRLVSLGTSDTARWLETTRESILERQRLSVTLSRQETFEAIYEASRNAADDWKLGDEEAAITEEAVDTACRFINALPLGIPSPTITGEPDGHISLEWYRHPRRILTVSIGHESRLYWAALIGSEDPRGSIRFVDRVPGTLLHYIVRVMAE